MGGGFSGARMGGGYGGARMGGMVWCAHGWYVRRWLSRWDERWLSWRRVWWQQDGWDGRGRRVSRKWRCSRRAPVRKCSRNGLHVVANGCLRNWSLKWRIVPCQPQHGRKSRWSRGWHSEVLSVAGMVADLAVPVRASRMGRGGGAGNSFASRHSQGFSGSRVNVNNFNTFNNFGGGFGGGFGGFGFGGLGFGGFGYGLGSGLLSSLLYGVGGLAQDTVAHGLQQILA